MSPGSGEVGLEVLRASSTLKSLVGSKDFSSSSSGSVLRDGEDTVWLAFLGLLVAESALIGVVHDHGLHEEVIRTSSEVLWWDSLVLLVEWASANVSWDVETVSLPLVLSELDEGVVIRVTARRGRVGVGRLLNSVVSSGLSASVGVDGRDLLNGESADKGGDSEGGELHYNY